MRIFISSLIVLGIAGMAMADDTPKGANGGGKKAAKKAHAAHGRGYGMAGCGLGSMAIGAKPGKLQMVSTLMNAIGSNQTFAITTGTSNCDLPQMGQQAAQFIEINREIVMKDAARGEGETIDSISAIMGCTDSQVLGSKLQKGYEHYFTNGVDSYETSRRIINSIKTDEDLKLVCAKVG